MKVSELIAALQAILATDGDRVVVIDDADTNWHLAIDTIETDAESGRVTIGGDYHSQESEELRS
jgi:hypothetical protein